MTGEWPSPEPGDNLPMTKNNSARILIADDQRDVLEALKLLLKSESYRVDVAASPAGIASAVESNDYDCLLMDLNYARDTTSGREGLDLLPRLQKLDNTLPVIVMTAWSSIETAVEAMRTGARDYVEKPWDNDRLIATLRTQIELGQALRKSKRLEDENRRLRSDLPKLIADSKAMQPVLKLMERVAPSDANVLISGEHGTGKEVVARWIYAASNRSSESLVTVNAGGLPEGVFESEVFGHVKGAFTDAKADRVGCFELAHGGTLFLDEIANVPLSQQAKLLRILETGELQRVGSSKMRTVDVRLISATNADLHDAANQGTFRPDLLYRLNTVEIQIPPLRERREDIGLFATNFLQETSKRYGRPMNLAPDAMQALLQHRWPGNVRELEHTIERATLMAEGDTIRGQDLGLQAKADAATSDLENMSLDDVEQYLIHKALTRFEGNVSQAASALGLSRSALYRRLQRVEP